MSRRFTTHWDDISAMISSVYHVVDVWFLEKKKNIIIIVRVYLIIDKIDKTIRKNSVGTAGSNREEGETRG